MKISLHYKLFGAFLAAILAVVIYMAIVMQWSFDRGFLNYISTIEHEHLVRLVDSLEGYYQEAQGWESLKQDPEKFIHYLIESYPEGKKKDHLKAKMGRLKKRVMPPPRGEIPKDEPMPFHARVFLKDEAGVTIFGFEPDPATTDSLDIMYQNRVVGVAGIHFAKNLFDSHQLIFAKRLKIAVILIAVAGFLIAAALSMPFSRRLTRPIRELAEGTRALASGRYDTRITVDSGDELGQLSADFNELATILEKNRKARGQWFADISHELRTPIAIMRGKIEGIQDGVYAPDEETLATLHTEITRLGLLVDDLYQLSLSDQGAMSYNRREVEPTWALDQAVMLHRQELEERGISLELEKRVEANTVLFGDNQRLEQLFSNLIGNAIRYTDSPGTIRVRVEVFGEVIHYIIEDSAPGVAQEHLDKLFDRLYRVESSRSRESGGVGLGLAICRNIVKAHGGEIEAGESELGGLRISVHLPVSEVV